MRPSEPQLSRRELARALTWIENGAPEAEAVIRDAFRRAGRAHVIGLTGPPGAGKSTLSGALIRAFRERGLTVGVLAVDPASPFSGGAVLGDRLRMQAALNDPGVFMRSLSNRGHLGGLCRAARDAVTLLDAYGLDTILVETVGVGQAEVEITALAHSVVVLQVPGRGDDVQTLKAGILEIGNVFVVNKADQKDAERALAALRMLVHIHWAEEPWQPPVIGTVAVDGTGVQELAAALLEHKHFLVDSGAWLQRQQIDAEAQVADQVTAQTAALLLRRCRDSGHWAELVAAVAERRLDPVTAATQIFGRCLDKALSDDNG